MRLVITGANSSVGKSLLRAIADAPDIQAVAGVRSLAALSFMPKRGHIEAAAIAYGNGDRLREQFASADAVVHLAGILIESNGSTYQSANIDATVAVVAAAKAAGVRRLVFVSVIGADAKSDNAYYRSKGLAEQAALESGLAASIIRTPILLGPGTAGSSSILGTASQSRVRLLAGGRHVMRPLDVADLCQAILNCCRSDDGGAAIYELVGPEALEYRELIHRVADLKGITIQIGSVPVWLAKLGALIRSRMIGSGITPAVIDVITAHETVQHNDAAALGIALTPLDNTLKAMLGNGK